mmetsp:Transcript_27773/g.65193  ORF Transcript_27773/g.65193 Transcript_27773/m.65193 type:complete len:231 (-) Transcript_27773:90-782(-)
MCNKMISVRSNNPYITKFLPSCVTGPFPKRPWYIFCFHNVRGPTPGGLDVSRVVLLLCNALCSTKTANVITNEHTVHPPPPTSIFPQEPKDVVCWRCSSLPSGTGRSPDVSSGMFNQCVLHLPFLQPKPEKRMAGHALRVQYMTSPTGSPALIPTAILPPEPKDIGHCWRRQVEHGHVRIYPESVGRVRRNLRESSTQGGGICGRLPSHCKTENGPPNQLSSDVPRIARS